MILDINAVPAMADGDMGLLRQMRSSHQHALPVIVLGEYRYGLQRSNVGQARLQWLTRLEQQMLVLDVTRETARHYADVKNELRRLGKPIPEADLWIAALSRESGLSVLSRDSHFDSVPGLIRIEW